MQSIASAVPQDHIVGSLYRAAAGELPWGESLDLVRQDVNGWGVHLHGIRLSDGAVTFSYEVGSLSAEGALAYITQYHQIDPRVGMLARLNLLEWVNCHEHFNEHFVANNRFYQEFLLPHGGRWASGTKVFHDDELIAIFGVHRGLGMQPLSPQEAALSQRYARHIHEALSLWRRQQRLLKSALVGNALIERLGHPVLLVDEQLQLVHANAQAMAVLERDDRLRQRDGMLTLPVRHQGDAALRAVRQLRLGGAASYREIEPAVERTVVRLESPDRPPLLMIFTPLRPEETMGAFGTRPLALVLLHDLGQAREPDPFLLSSAFGLTPAEGRVAARLAAGDSAQEVAEQNGVALSTVRTQVRNIYEKMGVARQGELVAALATLPALG